MDTNIIKQRALHASNYTTLHNEILFKNLSLEAVGLFLRLWSLPDNWKLSVKGLAKICNCGDQKITRIIQELETAGYLQKKQKRNGNRSAGFEYIIFETLDSNLWDIKGKNFEDLQSQDLENEDLESQDLENESQYNNINNKLYNFINKIDYKYPKKFLGESSLEQENLKQETCYKNSQNPLVKNNQMKETGDAQVKTPAQIKKEARRLERKKKQEIKIEQEQNKEMKSVADFAEMTLEDQTVEEGILANAKRLNNAAQEKLNEVNRRSGRKAAVKTRITSLIDHEIKDDELKELLKSFVSMWIGIGKKMTEEVYTQQIKTLTELSSDLNIQKEIVKRSLQHAWLGFYPLDNKQEQGHKPKPVYINTNNEENDAFEDAVDENGNLLKF